MTGVLVASTSWPTHCRSSRWLVAPESLNGASPASTTSGTSAGWTSPTSLLCPTRASLRSWWRRCCPTVRFWGLAGPRASSWGWRSSRRTQPAAPSLPRLSLRQQGCAEGPTAQFWLLGGLTNVGVGRAEGPWWDGGKECEAGYLLPNPGGSVPWAEGHSPCQARVPPSSSQPPPASAGLGEVGASPHRAHHYVKKTLVKLSHLHVLLFPAGT